MRAPQRREMATAQRLSYAWYRSANRSYVRQCMPSGLGGRSMPSAFGSIRFAILVIPRSALSLGASACDL
jgi:hypothetical protein